MYDHATKSYWSTLKGQPVVGPLVGKGIKLKRSHAVTTTWGAWKRRHPTTTVLSLNTGHKRNYDEGVAYKKYFATDRLMFGVPEVDNRLRNKDEVLALQVDNAEGNSLKNAQLAIAAEYLLQNRIFQDTVGDQSFVILTDATGANFVFESGGIEFKSWDEKSTAIDSTGGSWTVQGEALVSKTRSLKRLPAHRAFWFGWFAQFPETRLIK